MLKTCIQHLNNILMKKIFSHFLITLSLLPFFKIPHLTSFTLQFSIFNVSYFQFAIYPFSHFHILTLSHRQIITCSYFNIFTVSNCLTFTLSYFQIFPFCAFAKKIGFIFRLLDEYLWRNRLLSLETTNYLLFCPSKTQILEKALQLKKGNITFRMVIFSSILFEASLMAKLQFCRNQKV